MGKEKHNFKNRAPLARHSNIPMRKVKRTSQPQHREPPPPVPINQAIKKIIISSENLTVKVYALTLIGLTHFQSGQLLDLNIRQASGRVYRAKKNREYVQRAVSLTILSES